METIIWIILSTIAISLLSLIGVVTIVMKDVFLDKITLVLVSLSAGAMMGGAFLHLIPEAVAEFSNSGIFTWVIAGFVVFFFIEKVLHWRHCHEGKCEVHAFAYVNLIGDGFHNFLDGLIIAAAFIASIPLGIATVFAVALHEIPQEIADLGVLIHGGFDKWKALGFNFITAITAVAGGIIGFYLFPFVSNVFMILIPFAAGGFIYISASDLIPEIRKEMDFKKSGTYFGVFIIGILMMYGLLFI